ncbi:MAG: ABC transporter permease [Chloroflexota bacterium]
MTRLFATTRWDMQLQLRNGFYYVTAFIVVVWAILFLQVSLVDLGWLLPALILGNLIINTFYFVGGLVLLEKGEGTLSAQIVTPLRTEEYLSAKIISLTLLAVIENIIIASLFYGLTYQFLTLALGILLASIIYILAGFIIVVRYDAINEYLLPSVLYTSILAAPLLAYIMQWEHWLMYLHPLQGSLVLMQAAIQPITLWQWLYGIGYSVCSIGLLYYFSQKAFRRFVIAAEGTN